MTEVAAPAVALSFEPPFAWEHLLAFLRPRAIPAVEEISETSYSRNVRLEDRVARIEVRCDHEAAALTLVASGTRARDIEYLTARAGGLFDLDADPKPITASLSVDPTLGPLARSLPGLRLPGAWNGFELAIRAILGQQVTVRGATTLCGRLVEDYGTKTPNGFLFPEPAKLARARFTRVGIPGSRAAALRRLAGACSSGELDLEGDADPAKTVANLIRLRGIGDWTAQYIAMRALRDRDAFPSADLGLLQAAGNLLVQAPKAAAVRPARLRRLAESWRPWRAYAAMHLWHSLGSDLGRTK